MLVRLGLLSAELLCVQTSTSELNAGFVSPRGLRLPWLVASGGSSVIGWAPPSLCSVSCVEKVQVGQVE